jgi:hypothetical protein
LFPVDCHARVVAAALLAGLACPVLADHPSLSVLGGPAGAVTTITALPVPRGDWSLGLRIEHVGIDAFSDAELLDLAARDEDVHSIDSLSRLSLGTAYGLTDNLTLGITLPYVSRKNVREAHHGAGTGPIEVESLGDAEGLGDASLYGLYRWRERADGRQHSALVFGVKTPTGKTDVRSPEGELLEVELQPGSGSWDPFAGLAFTWLQRRSSIDASLVYRISTEGSQDTTLGDVFAYSASYSFRVSPASDHAHAHGGEQPHPHTAFDLLLELNGEWRDKDEVAGTSKSNTGGNLIYLSPGLRYAFAGAWVASLSVGLPVVTDLNGFQTEPEYRVIGGISVGL